MPPISLSDKVLPFVRELFSPGESVIAAVSGGSDSVALLFLLCDLRERLGISEIVAAHFNHGLRGAESDGDEELVREHAGKLGLRFFAERLTGQLHLDSPGLEEAARRHRYDFFDKVRRQTSCAKIATGHTLDDQAETVLMRMVRGSGINGLRAIAPHRGDGVVRPLLTMRKQELVEWLVGKSIAFRTDSSNADTRFFRNRIRHEILPLLEAGSPGATVNLAAIAENAQMLWRDLQPIVTEWLRDFYRVLPDGSFRVRKAGLTDTGAASEALRQVFTEHGIEPDRHHLCALFKNSKISDATFLLPGSWKYRVCRDDLMFEKEVPSFDIAIPVPGCGDVRQTGQRLIISCESTLPAHLDRGKDTVYINGDSLGTIARFRTITREDRFIPFGTTREVSMLQFLTKQGVPLMERERTGCLFSQDNKPVWISGVRLDERFRVGAGAKKVIKVLLLRQNES